MSYDAVQLLHRERLCGSTGFRPKPEELPTVAGICCMLDGIPLAIEMAAAQVPALSVAEIASSLDSTFSLLTSGRRTAPAAPANLARNAGLELCVAPARRSNVYWRCLSVFTGSLTADAARIVCGDEEELPPPKIRGNHRQKTHLGRAVALVIPPADVAPLLGATGT